MRELIDDGQTGFVVSGVDDALAAVDRASTLDRALIRVIAIKRFHHDRMVDEYLDVYRRVLDGEALDRLRQRA